jgi:maltose O-acetyltransferase
VGNVTMCDDVWIGAGALLIPNVMIGKHAQPSPRAQVVTKNVPARTVVTGNPARALRSLDE